VSRHSQNVATRPPGEAGRAAAGGVSKAKTAFFALRSSRLLRQHRRDISPEQFRIEIAPAAAKAQAQFICAVKRRSGRSLKRT
jgi:hypothetical protein